MTRKWKIALGAVAAIGIGGAAFALTGAGSQALNTAKLEMISAAAASQGGRWGHRDRRGHGLHRICSDSRSQRLEGGIDFVEAFFSFNDEQRPAWDALAAALRNGSDAIGRHCATLGERPSTAPGKLAVLETAMTAGLDVVREVRPAFERFYGTLNEDQQAAIDRLVDRRGRR